jgi:hypothetical protein
MLHGSALILDSLFDGNVAKGNGANMDDASKCDCINNGQHEVGSGGNGGAIYKDGGSDGVTVCGTQIRNNTANAFGSGIFFTNDGSGSTITIDDSSFHGNTAGKDWWEWCPDVSTDSNGLSPTPINSTFCVGTDCKPCTP